MQCGIGGLQLFYPPFPGQAGVRGLPGAAAGAGHLDVDGIVAAPGVDDTIIPPGIGVAIHTLAFLEFQPAQHKLALDAVGSVDGLFIGDVMVEELTDRNGKTEVVNKDSCCIMGAGFLCSLLRHFAPLKIDVAERKNGRLWQGSR